MEFERFVYRGPVPGNVIADQCGCWAKVSSRSRVAERIRLALFLWYAHLHHLFCKRSGYFEQCHFLFFAMRIVPRS